jgi:hypothetical protein
VGAALDRIDYGRKSLVIDFAEYLILTRRQQKRLLARPKLLSGAESEFLSAPRTFR